MTLSGHERNNQAFMSAALEWLRAVLEAAVPADGTTGERGDRSAEKRLRELRAARDQAAHADPAPAMTTIAVRLNLSSFETDVLLLAAAAEIDSRIPALIARVLDDPARRAPTFALAMTLFADHTWDALVPNAPLRGWRLIEVHQSGSMPLIAAPLRIDERIAAYLMGNNYLDERIDAMCERVNAPKRLPPSQQRVADSLAAWLHDPAPGVMQLAGVDRACKRDVAAKAAGAANVILLSLDFADLPQVPDTADQFARLWSREARLLRLALLVDGIDPGESDTRERGDAHAMDLPRALRPLRRLDGKRLIDTREPIAELVDASLIVVNVPPPDERAALWADALHMPPGSLASSASPASNRSADAGVARLAAEFSLSASQIAALGAEAALRDDDAKHDEVRHDGAKRDAAEHNGEQLGVSLATQAWRVAVAHAAGTLDGLAQRIEPAATLADVKLPDHEAAQLTRLVAHARERAAVGSRYGFRRRGHRGFGLTALFHGESGVGKTMAAEAVAHELALALFRIDLSAVVSKYIGETSKNLRRVFDAAEAGGTVLFIDEADAVIGRRTEVKDSHDRYANIDINYLLTRMESFGGVAILATNMKHALDPAFVRRLRFIIGFPYPGMAQRKAIWESVFPERSQVGALDFDWLARYALTGGGIFNAALAAAHDAAHDAAAGDGKIEMPHVLDAIRWELLKNERPLSERAFEWRGSSVAATSAGDEEDSSPSRTRAEGRGRTKKEKTS